MKDNTASVLRAGQSLGALFSEVGKTIETKKKEIKTKEILDSFKDPKKTFFKPDGTLANPLEVQQKYNQGFNELMSIGSINEAKGLASQFSDSYKIIGNEQANQFNQDAILVKNPHFKDAFKNVNLNWAPNEAVKLAADKTVAPKYYAGKVPDPQWNWKDPETNEEFPGWSSLIYITDTTGNIKMERIGEAPDPNPVKESISRSSQYFVDGTKKPVRNFVTADNQAIYQTSDGTYYEAGSNKKITDTKILNGIREVTGTDNDVTNATVAKVEAETEKTKAETLKLLNNNGDANTNGQLMVDVNTFIQAPVRDKFMELWGKNVKSSDIEQAIRDGNVAERFNITEKMWKMMDGWYPSFEKKYKR